jgi:hypothetical protein
VERVKRHYRVTVGVGGVGRGLDSGARVDCHADLGDDVGVICADF